MPEGFVDLTLKIKVRYNLNGESVEDLKSRLDNIPMFLAGNGMLSGDTDAEVEEYNHEVIEG